MRMTRIEELRELRESGELSDIGVTVDKAEFHLHKFPLYLNSEFFRALCRCGMIDEDRVNLSNFPGGSKTFSLVADYCYGEEINIDHSNVAELRCAAEYLQMISAGNLACETSTALTRILRSPERSVSEIVNIISRCCRLGAIACQTNVVSSCFAAVLEMWKTDELPEAIMEVLRGVPVEWFVGLAVGARDGSVSISSMARLVGQYLETLVNEKRTSIEECLRGGDRADMYVSATLEEIGEDLDIGEIMDFILLELPENAPLDEVMDGELLCFLFRIAAKLHCKCEGILLRAVSKILSSVSSETLVTMTTNNMITIAEYNSHNKIVPPAILCNTLDAYLRERVKRKAIDVNEFQAVSRALPKDYREQHDSLLIITQELFAAAEITDETKLKILDAIEPRRLREETLRNASERKLIPSSFIVNSALAVSSRLRNDLTEAKAELANKDKTIREMQRSVTDVIKGQWECNDVIVNVTPKDVDNTRVQFAKVLSRNTSTDLSMEHEQYEGKMTLCVRSLRGTSTQSWFLFDPFNEQLIEIKRSKYDTLMVGENYQKKKHTASYWPFNDAS